MWTRKREWRHLFVHSCLERKATATMDWMDIRHVGKEKERGKQYQTVQLYIHVCKCNARYQMSFVYYFSAKHYTKEMQRTRLL